MLAKLSGLKDIVWNIAFNFDATWNTNKLCLIAVKWIGHATNGCHNITHRLFMPNAFTQI